MHGGEYRSFSDSARAAGSLLLIRQTIRDVFARVGAAADSDHNILLTTQHVGHWRTALNGRHQNRTNLLAGLLVVGPQHGAPRMLGRSGDLWIAHYDQRLCHPQSYPGGSRLSG